MGLHMGWPGLAKANARMAAFLAAIVASGPLFAEPGHTDSFAGNAEVRVVEPIGIQTVADLRFGRIMQPATAGTLTLAYTGAITETGGVVGQSNTPQLPNGRGPGAFAVFGDANRLFLAFLPGTITLSNGATTMLVNQIQANPGGLLGLRRFNADGYAPLLIGGRLNVNANQASGTYTGTYNVTVLYL